MMKGKLSIGILSDEISPDPVVALRYARLWDIPVFEIRCLRSGRIPAVSKEEFSLLKDAVRDGAIRISALSPGIFKGFLSQKERTASELNEVLPRTIEQARELGAGMVIVFPFRKEAGESSSGFQAAGDILRAAADRAARSGLTLAVENEPGCWCDTGAGTAAMIKAVGSASLRANWDPCNAYGTGEVPFPDGYRAVKEYIANVHVKDTLTNALSSCVPVGEGIIDWRGQIGALLEDGLVPHVTVETHCLPLVERSRQNVETLRRYMSEHLQEGRP